MSAVKISRHVPAAHVVLALEAGSRDDVVRELAARLAAAGALPKPKAAALADEVLAREGEGTTGIGGGVAVPHAKTTLVKELLVAVGLTADGVDWASVDGDRVHVVFLIAAPPDANQAYLALMRAVVTLTRSRYGLKLLRACTTPEAVVEVLEESMEAPAGGR